MVIGRRFWIVIWYGILVLGVLGLGASIYWGRQTNWKNTDELLRAIGTIAVSAGMLLLLNEVAEGAGELLLLASLVVFILAFVWGRRAPEPAHGGGGPSEEEEPARGPDRGRRPAPEKRVIAPVSGAARRILPALLLFAPIALRPLAGQQAMGPTTGGIVALHEAERMLGHSKRLLMIAAHPDDEDTELLTVLVRGQGAEAAYLSLSRGEGGQNLIGSELGEELGLIRTGEPLGAGALDGARQYFPRAFDFGFSKTLEETPRFWPRDSVLKDVVRVVRRFRPQVIVSIFSGTPRAARGH